MNYFYFVIGTALRWIGKIFYYMSSGLGWVSKHCYLLSIKVHLRALPVEILEVLSSELKEPDLDGSYIIHKIDGEPLHRDEIDPDTIGEDVPYSMEWAINATAEFTKGELVDVVMWYRDEEDAKRIWNHFQTSIEPMEFKK